MRTVLFCLSLLATASPLHAQEALGLAAPEAVRQSGLLKHMLPRFSLKTGVRVVHDPDGAMAITIAPPGDPVFRGDNVVYFLRTSDDARQARFRDWLLSDIGKRTIDAFQPGGNQPFSSDVGAVEIEEETVFTGDAALGAKLSLVHCGRCHVLDESNRMRGLGSTPSFMVLRALPDWAERFQQFYVRKPHGAFTQIDGVTAPFNPEAPPPIFPVRISLDDLEAILAFVTAVPAADLGAPLQFQ